VRIRFDESDSFEHKSMAPNWYGALRLALDALGRDAARGKPIPERIKIEEK